MKQIKAAECIEIEIFNGVKSNEEERKFAMSMNYARAMEIVLFSSAINRTPG